MTPAPRSQGQDAGSRRGAAYIVVLGAALIIAALASGALLVTRAKGRTAAELSDAALARQYARDGVELARAWIKQDAEWRTNRPTGIWVSNQPISSGTFTVEASDPLDGDIANLPHDPVVLKVTGTKGSARHVLQVTLQPRPVSLPMLQYALQVVGQLHLNANKTLSVSGATASTASTDGALRNEGTIIGNINVGSVESLGTVSGAQVIGSAPKGTPSVTIYDRYAALGTLINPGSGMQKVVLGPGYNPYGVANPYGVYVIRPTDDFTIENCRISGTLVVICPPGKSCKLDKGVFIEPCRSDMPALLIQGVADLQADGAMLTEAPLGVNLNPAGAPYNGASDADQSDNYPNELRGLVHVSGRVTIRDATAIHGALMCNATDASDAALIETNITITFTATLITSPPCWYTTQVDMPVARGTWLQLAN